MNKIDVEILKAQISGLGTVEAAGIRATLALVEATDRQTAEIKEQGAHQKRIDALLIGMQVLMQNNNAHQAALKHLFQMMGNLITAAEQIPNFKKSPENVLAAFEGAVTFLKAGGQNFGQLFGRVLSAKAYDALPAQERAIVDEQIKELELYVRAQVGK